MALVVRFEDLRAWQEAWRLTTKVHQLTTQGTFAHDFG